MLIQLISGLLLAGGRFNITGCPTPPSDLQSSVEFWLASYDVQFHCELPSLPNPMEGLTLDFIDDGHVIECYQDVCNRFTNGAWTYLQKTKQSRRFHTSTVIGDKILLVGGADSPHSAEMVRVDGGISMFSFFVDPGRAHHCSITMNQDSIILTGGQDPLG